jgi:NTP pyrophosphatase (non-canonical NTP hydrolase)
VSTPTISQQATPEAMWAHVAMLVAWLDSAHPRTDHEIACRVMKLAEETGEVVNAYLGWTGQNPRKGQCATRDDVASELCDVIVTALVALASISGDVRGAEAFMQGHLARRFAKLLERIGRGPTDPAHDLAAAIAAAPDSPRLRRVRPLPVPPIEED